MNVAEDGDCTTALGSLLPGLTTLPAKILNTRILLTSKAVGWWPS